MRIAMLGVKAVPAIGGIAHYAEELGARLVQRGHEVTVYCRPHFLQDEAEVYRGMRRVVTRGLRGKHLDAISHTLTAALHALKEGFDIIHIHGSAPGVIAPLLRLRRGPRIVVTIHGLDWRGSKWGGPAAQLMYLAARTGACGAHEVAVVSRAAGDEYRRRVGREPVFVPTGVVLPELMPAVQIRDLGLTPGGYLFCAARLVPEKGVHYLVDAFSELGTGMKLVVAGDCPYEDAYVKRLRAAASDRIIFAGYVRGRLLAELYSNAYLYVQPSEMEGLPIAVLEALSYGRYVLASDIPQNCEALGPCGGTFRSKNVRDLRRKLGDLLVQPELVEQQSERTRSFIRRERNWDVTTLGYEQLYAGLGTRRVELTAVT